MSDRDATDDPGRSGQTEVSGIHITWQTDEGTCAFEGLPVAMMWVDTTLMGLMSGVQAMVGTERFGLALQSEGRKSVEADWRVISQFQEFPEGFAAIANIAAVAGWGDWKLISLDPTEKVCRFRVRNSWEGQYQKTLGVCWGSGMLAGKLAGYCSRFFRTNCWSDQTAFIADGDAYDEFEVRPSERSVEREIEELLATDNATRADMAVALRRLQDEMAERRQTERALRESEKRFRDLANSLPETVFETDPEGNLTFVNNMAFEEFGYTREDLKAKLNAFEMIAPEDREDARERFARRLGGDDFGSSEYTAQRKDGSRFAIILHAIPILKDGRPAGLRGIVVDISDRKRIEQERIRTQRLSAVGELAAGISHNLNNVLTGILGPAQLLTSRTEDPEVLDELDAIVSSAIRARDLIKRLNRSIQGVDEAVRPVPVNETVMEAIRASRPRWKDEAEARGCSIEVVTELTEAPRAAATEAGLHDVLLNLVFNAVDAMPDGGVATIRTETTEDRVVLTVSDTGIGMDESTRDRVFEPFFTTKTDIGTGLGLSTVYNAVARWGGGIEVESAPGSGTTFTIWLPVWKQEETQAHADQASLQSRRARIVVVEDDATVRDFVCRLLSADHDVAAYASGQEAMDGFAPGCCDVALIDLGITGRPGDQVAHAMRDADPRVCTVLITGWRLPEDDPRLALFDFHLEKPFDSLTEVRQVIAQATALHDERAESL